MSSKKRLLQRTKLYLVVSVTPRTKLSFFRIEAALRGGVDVLQLRCKGISDSLFLRYAQRLRKITKSYKCIFIINDRPDIALLASADGVHIGQDDIDSRTARKFLGREQIIGLSTHSIRQIRDASSNRAVDYIGIGPIFKTPTKPKARPIGPAIIKKAASFKKLPPFFVIGGIDTENLQFVKDAGAQRVAVVRAIMNAKNPQLTAKRFKDILNGTD